MRTQARRGQRWPPPERGAASRLSQPDAVRFGVSPVPRGEETGTLGRVMGRVADFYDRDLTKQLNQLAKMAEPVMLLIMGVLVGTIVSSLILPIFKLSRAVH